jgi:tape measure domain-containing protein
MATEKRIKIVVDSKNAKRDVDDLDNSMRGLGGTADRTTSGLSTLSRVATAVISAVAVQRVVAYADAFSELQTQLKLVTDSSAELNRTTQTLLKLSNETASSLDGTVGIYTKLTRATEQLEASEEEILAVTRAINQSFVISGASAEEAANAIRQLNQGLASGVLRGEEFNAINENADRLARALADSLGVTRGELRALAAEGVLTTETVFNALKGQADAINDEYGQVDLTVGRAFSNLNDSLTVAVGRFDQATGASGAFAQGIDRISDAINDADFKSFGEDVAEQWDLAYEGLIRYLPLVALAEKVNEAYANSADDNNDTVNEGLRETIRLYGQLAQVTGMASPRPVRVDQDGASQSTGVLRSDAGAANEFATEGTTEVPGINPKGGATGEAALILLRNQAAEDAARAREELERQNQAILSEQFVQSEQMRTEQLQNELARRLEVQRAYEETSFGDDATFYERRLAENQFRKEEQLAMLEEERQNEIAQQQLRRERIIENERLTSEARQEALAEIREQELTQQQIFEDKKTRIEQEAAQTRTEIKKAEEQAKLQATLGAASDIIGAIGAIGKNSVKVQKAVAIAQAGISIASGIARAQELGFPANIAEAARVAAVGAKAFSAIRSAEVGGSPANPQSVASGSGGAASVSASTPIRTQEPPSQSSVFEIKGFSELAQRLSEFDPGEPLPAEIAQRLAISIESIRTLEGGSA